MAPIITFGGLATGLDTNALIDGLMKVERLPLVRNEQKTATVTSAKSTLSSFLNSLTAVRTAAQNLDTAAEFAAYNVTSTDDTIATATATGAASAGKFTVKVNAVALETRTKTNTFSDSSSALNQAGDLQVTVGGNTVNVGIVATDSLAAVAQKVNTANAGITATVINNGSSAQLLFAGKNTGLANQVTYAQTGTVNLGNLTANTYQNAADAQIVIDGQITVNRSTNQFTDVIPGLTITAKKIDATPVTIEVAADPDGQASKIQAFIDAYNSAVSAGHLAAGYGSIKASNSELSGDSAVRRSLDSIASTVSNSIPNLSGKYNQLAAVGVKLNNDGTLKLDKTLLTKALGEDPAAVSKVFVGDSGASVTGAMKRISDTVDKLTTSGTGIVPIRIDQFTRQLTQLEKDHDNLERRLDIFEASLRAKFTQLEKTVSQIQFQGNGLTGFTGLATAKK
jgi:flagellar hook-associated protein 2